MRWFSGAKLASSDMGFLPVGAVEVRPGPAVGQSTYGGPRTVTSVMFESIVNES